MMIATTLLFEAFYIVRGLTVVSATSVLVMACGMNFERKKEWDWFGNDYRGNVS